MEIGIESSVLQQIIRHEKTIEGRLRKGKFLDIHTGDRIKLREDFWENGSITRSVTDRATIKVTDVQYFKDFTTMLNVMGFKHVIPSAETIDDALAIYRKFYDQEEENRLGVVAFSFELI